MKFLETQDKIFLQDKLHTQFNMATIKKIIAPKEQRTASDALKSLMSDKELAADIYNSIVPDSKIVSTGSLILDSVVRVRSGQVVRLVGKGAELGKTSSAFVLAENFMNVMPKSKTIFVKAEGRLSNEMKKRVGLNFVDSVDEWTYGTVFVLSCNVFETVAKIILDVIKTAHAAGEHICIILDSLDGLILKNDLEKGFEGNAKVAGVPLLTKLLFRHLALPIAHYDALLLVTGQYAADIKLDPYAPNIPRQASSSGGSSIGHQSDYVFEFQPRYNGDQILENENEKPSITNRPLGVWASLIIRKSANDNSGISVKYPVKKGVVGCAVWRSYEIADLLIQYEMVSKSGSWLTVAGDVVEKAKLQGIELREKVQGMKKLFEYIEEDEAARKFFEEEIMKIIQQ